jgi:hypothetical protein
MDDFHSFPLLMPWFMVSKLLKSSSNFNSPEFIAPRLEDRKEKTSPFISELGVLCVFARVIFLPIP